MRATENEAGGSGRAGPPLLPKEITWYLVFREFQDIFSPLKGRTPLSISKDFFRKFSG